MAQLDKIEVPIRKIEGLSITVSVRKTFELKIRFKLGLWLMRFTVWVLAGDSGKVNFEIVDEVFDKYSDVHVALTPTGPKIDDARFQRTAEDSNPSTAASVPQMAQGTPLVVQGVAQLVQPGPPVRGVRTIEIDRKPVCMRCGGGHHVSDCDDDPIAPRYDV